MPPRALPRDASHAESGAMLLPRVAVTMLIAVERDTIDADDERL